METVAETRRKRLEILITEYGTQRALADALERSPSQLSQWKSASKYSGNTDRRRAMEDDTARFIEAKTGKPKGWMDQPLNAAASEGVLPPTAPMLTAGAAPPPEQYIRLPVLGRAAAGTGQEALGEHIATMDVFIPWFRRVYGRSPAGVSLLTAKGGSMSGVIEDGDVMFVVPVQEFADDGIYIVAIGDLLRVKRLKLRIDGTLAIESTDGSAPELMPLAQVGDTLRIQGRVIGSLGVRKHG